MSDGVVLNIYISQDDVWEAGSATAVMNLLTRQATDAIAEWVKNREQGQSETTS